MLVSFSYSLSPNAMMDSRVRKEVCVWREGRTLEVSRSLVSQDCGYESHFPPRLGGTDEHLTSSSTRTNSFVLYQRCHPEGKRNSFGAKVKRLDGTAWYKRPRKIDVQQLVISSVQPPSSRISIFISKQPFSCQHISRLNRHVAHKVSDGPCSCGWNINGLANVVRSPAW